MANRFPTVKNLDRELPIILLASIVFLCPQGALGRKYAGEFMALGGGARALGMGGAFTAVAGDASTVFWNPAGISGFEKLQALFMHSERFGQLVNYNFASFVTPTDWLEPGDKDSPESGGRKAAFGFAVIHMGIDDIIITKDLKYIDANNDKVFRPEDGDRLLFDESLLPRESNNDFAFFGSFALKTARGRFGGTLKILYTDAVAGYTSAGVGVDIGFLKRDLLPNFSIGAKLQDATGTYISWSTGKNEFIAPSLKVGTAYVFQSSSLNGSFLVALDGDIYFENRKYASQFWIGRYSADLHLGAELRFQERVAVRGGVDTGHPTAGAGFRLGFLGFDYAYLHHDAFEATHRVSAYAEF